MMPRRKTNSLPTTTPAPMPAPTHAPTHAPTPAPMTDPTPAPTSAPAPAPTVRKSNPWLDHVKSYKAKNPHVSHKDALKMAKETYRK